MIFIKAPFPDLKNSIAENLIEVLGSLRELYK